VKLKTKKNSSCVIYDFDNVIYRDTDHKYDELYEDNIVDGSSLPIPLNNSSVNVLLTGRGQFLERKLLELLSTAGYEFDEVIFFKDKRKEYPAFNSKLTLLKYYKQYWSFKISAIKSISKKFKNVTVIDDDDVIIDYIDKKMSGVQAVHFDCREV